MRSFRVLGMAVGGALLLGCQSAGPAASMSALRVMTYNLHHGEGMDGRVDLERIAAVISRERPDLVSLQEVDKGVQRTQRRDLASELAARTGLTCVFSNNFHYQGGEYGNAILSRLPVLGTTNRHYRMVRAGEQRGLLEVRVRMAGRPIRFFATHLDFRPDDTERVSNVSEIRSALGTEPGTPAIVAGDFNDLPGRRVHGLMRAFLTDAWEQGGDGPGWTFPAPRPERRIDYVFVSPGFLVRRAWVPETEASDHRPLVVDLEFGP